MVVQVKHVILLTDPIICHLKNVIEKQKKNKIVIARIHQGDIAISLCKYKFNNCVMQSCAKKAKKLEYFCVVFVHLNHSYLLLSKYHINQIMLEKRRAHSSKAHFYYLYQLRDVLFIHLHFYTSLKMQTMKLMRHLETQFSLFLQ